MAFKRLVGVVTIQNGFVVKSNQYESFYPGGSLRSSLENLDRWGADEIIILDISRGNKINSSTVKQIKSANISTPLVYGGGIRELSDIKLLLDAGCDRFVVENIMLNNNPVIEEIAHSIGEQALIGSIPIKFKDERLFIANLINKKLDYRPIEDSLDSINRSPVSEFFISATETDGKFGMFPLEIFESIKSLVEIGDLREAGILWFGGIDEKKARRLLEWDMTRAVCFGNINNEREIFITTARKSIRSSLLR